MVIGAGLLAAVEKLATSLGMAAGRHVLADLLKKGSRERAFKFAILDTRESYQRSNRVPSSVVEALLLTVGPLHHEKARVELAKLLDVAEQPDVVLIAEIWKTAVADPSLNVNYCEETEWLLTDLSNHLSRTDEFRAYIDSRYIRSADSMLRDMQSSFEHKTSEKYKPELSNSLDGLYPSFYFPLHLGRLNQKADRDSSRDEKHSDPLEFPLAWQEARATTGRPRYEREAADSVWNKIKNNTRGIFVILGEPGAGKSKLLQHWHAQANSDAAQMIRLRNVSQVPAAPQREQPPTLWLLDGWDELARDQRKAEQVNALPGLKIVTCRTAVYQGEFDKFLGGTAVHYVMGMFPVEQREFLYSLVSAWNGSQHTQLIRSGLANADQSWAEQLWKSVQVHHNVRTLAGNPLLLTLLAVVSPPGRATQLPENCAGFYQNAYDYLCKNRHPTGIDSLAYGATLQWLVNAVGSSRVHRNTEIPRRILDDAYRQLDQADTSRFKIDTLLSVALTSGVLKDFGTRHEFLHLTFQEWCLAQYFQQSEGFQSAIERYWDNADYFEVLALLWSMGTSTDRDVATRFLMKVGYRVHTVGGTSRTASGLRTMLHLWSQSGVGMEPDLGNLFDEVRQFCTRSELIKFAIASAEHSPGELLMAITCDPDNNVRSIASSNLDTPLDISKSLPSDLNHFTRFYVARHPNASVDVLKLLACNPHDEIRSGVAGNPNTPVELLTSLASDPSDHVCREVARNPGTPLELLKSLASSLNLFVRSGVAMNPNAPVGVLTLLAIDSHSYVLSNVATNPNTPDEALRLLSSNPRVDVRIGVAGNSNTPVDVLTLLAIDSSSYVRRNVARNLNTPVNVLSLLSINPHVVVRSGLAGNPNTPVNVLTLLANDPDIYVRECLAMNPSTPAELLPSLARDPGDYALSITASDPDTPVDVLKSLACNPHDEVRLGVAENPNTPIEVLRSLSGDLDQGVRWCVARNPNTPVDVLKSLASDPDHHVRIEVATNPNTPLELLIDGVPCDSL